MDTKHLILLQVTILLLCITYSCAHVKPSTDCIGHDGSNRCSKTQMGISFGGQVNSSASRSSQYSGSSSSQFNSSSGQLDRSGSSSSQKSSSSSSQQGKSSSSSSQGGSSGGQNVNSSSLSNRQHSSSGGHKGQSSSSSSKQHSYSGSHQEHSSSSSSKQHSSSGNRKGQSSSTSSQQHSLSGGQQGQSNSSPSQQSSSSGGQQGRTSSSSSQQGSASSSQQSNVSSSAGSQQNQQGSSTQQSSSLSSGAVNSSSSSQQAGSNIASTLNSNSNFSLSSNINPQGAFPKIFAFGGSYTDTGNSFMLNGLKAFVGAMLRNSPLAKNLPGQRLCNGRLLIDFLCEALKLPTLSPYKLASSNFTSGVNFAIAGSTNLPSNSFSGFQIGHNLFWEGIPKSCQTQIDWFNQYLLNNGCKGKTQPECQAEIEKALFWIGEIGITDLARIFGTSVSAPGLTKQTAGFVTKLVQTLLTRGAKYIVVQGLPPLGCCPLHLAFCPIRNRDEMGCSAKVNAIVKAHNELLQQAIAQLRAAHPSCKITYADTWNAYKSVLAAHKNFQLAEPFKACCGAGGGILNFDVHSLCGSTGSSKCKDPQNYIHWDGIHFTEAMHFHIADHLINRGFCNPPFPDLIKARLGK